MEKKLLKVKFNITLQNITAEYKSAFTFKLMIKRGDIMVESNRQFKYQPTTRQDILISEKFKLSTAFEVNTLKDTEEMLEKSIKIYFLVLTSKGFQPASNLEIEMSKLNLEEDNDLNLEFKKHNLSYLSLKIKLSPYDLQLDEYNEKELNSDKLLSSNTKNTTNSSFVNNLNSSFSSIVGNNDNNLNKNNFSNTLTSSNSISIKKIPTMSTNTGNSFLGGINQEKELPVMLKNDNKLKNNNIITAKPSEEISSTSIGPNIPKVTKPLFNSQNLEESQSKIEVSDLKNKLEEKINQIENLTQEKRIKDEEIELMKNNELNNKKEISLLKDKIKSLTSENLYIKENFEKIKDSNTSYERNQILILEKNIKEKEKEIESYIYQTNVQEEKLKELNLKVEKLNKCIDDYSIEKEKNKKEFQKKELELKKSNTDFTSLINTMKNQISELEKKLEFSESLNFDNKNDKNKNNNKIYEQKLEELELELKQAKDETEEVKNELNNKDEEIEQFKSIIESFKKEKNKLYDEKISAIKEEKEKVEYIKNQSIDLENNIAALKEIIQEQQEKIDEFEMKENDLNKILDDKNNQIKFVQENLQKEQSLISGYLMNISELQHSITKAKDEINELKKANFEHESQIELYQNSNKRNSILNSNEILVKENTTLKERLNEVYNNEQNEVELLKEEKSNLIIENSELLVKVNSLNEKVYFVETQLKALQNIQQDNINLQLKLDSINEKNVQFIGNSKDIEEKYKEEFIFFKESLQSKEDQLEEIQNKYNEAMSQITKLQDSKLKRRTSNDDRELLEQLDTLRNRFDIREKEIVAEKDYELRELKNKIEELDKNNKEQELNQQITKLKSENASLISQIKSMKMEIEEYDILKEKESGKIEELLVNHNIELSNLRQKISSLEDQFNLKTFSLNESKQQIEILQMDLITKSELIANLLNENSEMKEELEKYEKQLKEKKKKGIFGL